MTDPSRNEVLSALAEQGFARPAQPVAALGLGMSEGDDFDPQHGQGPQRGGQTQQGQSQLGQQQSQGQPLGSQDDRPQVEPHVRERIVDTYVLEGKFLEEKVVDEHFVVGVKPYKTVEKIVEVPQVVVKEVTKVVKKPEVIERLVEKPKIEIEEIIQEIPIVKTVEKVVEVPQIVYEEKIVHVPKIVYEDRVIEVPKVVYDEHIVYEDKIEYREVIVDKVIEEVENKTRTITRRIEKPIPMYMDVTRDKYVEDNSGKILSEIQSVVKTEEVPKISFEEFPVRKKVPVPVYRMLFPDGTKRIVKSIPGYPELPRPRSYLEENLGIESGRDEGPGFLTRRTNLGVNPNLVNTTKPPPKFHTPFNSTDHPQSDPQQKYMPTQIDQTVAEYNQIPAPQVSYYQNQNQPFYNSNNQNAIHPDMRQVVGGAR